MVFVCDTQNWRAAIVLPERRAIVDGRLFALADTVFVVRDLAAATDDRINLSVVFRHAEEQAIGCDKRLWVHLWFGDVATASVQIDEFIFEKLTLWLDQAHGVFDGFDFCHLGRGRSGIHKGRRTKDDASEELKGKC